jgi:hypothetical protein
MDCGAKNVYNHAEPSYVSWPSALSEQSVKLYNGEQRAGSWNAKVPLRYRGCRKPVYPDPKVGDVWFGLKRFCQFSERARYFWESLRLPRPVARRLMQKSS